MGSWSTCQVSEVQANQYSLNPSNFQKPHSALIPMLGLPFAPGDQQTYQDSEALGIQTQQPTLNRCPLLSYVTWSQTVRDLV